MLTKYGYDHIVAHMLETMTERQESKTMDTLIEIAQVVGIGLIVIVAAAVAFMPAALLIAGMMTGAQ